MAQLHHLEHLRLATFITLMTAAVPGYAQVDAVANSVVLVEVRNTDKTTNFLSGCVVDELGTVVTNLRPLKRVDQAYIYFPGEKKPFHVTGYRVASDSSGLVLLAVRNAPAVKQIEMRLDLPEDDAKVVLYGTHPSGVAQRMGDGQLLYAVTGEELSQLSGTFEVGPHAQWLCSTAAVPRRCSGGPMVDPRGKVIGILNHVPGIDPDAFVAHAVHVSHVQQLVSAAQKDPAPLRGLRDGKSKGIPLPIDVPATAPPTPITEFPPFFARGESLPEAVIRHNERHGEHERLRGRLVSIGQKMRAEELKVQAVLDKISADIAEIDQQIAKVSKSDIIGVRERNEEKGSKDEEFKIVIQKVHNAAERLQVKKLEEQQVPLRNAHSQTNDQLKQVQLKSLRLQSDYPRVFLFRENRLTSECLWLADPLRLRTLDECREALAAIDALRVGGGMANELNLCSGLLHARLGEFDQAQADIDAAMARLPPQRQVFGVLAGSLVKAWKGDVRKANLDLMKARKAAPSASVTGAIQAAMALSEGDPDRASRHLKTLADGGNAVERRRALALLLATCPEPKVLDARNAVLHAGEACQLSNWSDGFSLAALALAQHRAGNNDLALSACEAAIRHSTGSQKARCEAWRERIRAKEEIVIDAK